MRYILATSITLGCSSLCLYLMKYFSNRKRKSEMSERIKVLEEKFWGCGKENLVDTNIRPCSLDFSEQLVQDLKDQLKHFETLNKPKGFFNIIRNKTCVYSLPGLLSYWLNKYDFDERNKLINKYQHYKTNIQGLDIHFIRVKPDNPENYPVFPLLLLHGWPSSILEFYKIIPLLATSKSDYKFALEIIIPSLPGFGLSSAPKIPGLSCVYMSVILKNLMLRIGHSKFYVHGCDWTAYIVRVMSSLFPQHVLGMHSYMCAFLEKPEDIFFHFSLTKINERVKLWNKSLTENEYFHIQAANLDTIGFGLNNSPGALAAYIMGKFLLYTNLSEKEILEVYTYDELIDNLMIYWASKCITTSKQTYAQQFIEEETKLFKLIDSIQVTVPCGFTQYFVKFMKLPKLLKKQFKNILRISYSYRSGRFPALEQPEYFADDMWLHIYNMRMYWYYTEEKQEIPRLSAQKKKFVFFK